MKEERNVGNILASLDSFGPTDSYYFLAFNEYLCCCVCVWCNNEPPAGFLQ